MNNPRQNNSLICMKCAVTSSAINRTLEQNVQGLNNKLSYWGTSVHQTSMVESKTLGSCLLGTQLRFTSKCHVRSLIAFR